LLTSEMQRTEGISSSTPLSRVPKVFGACSSNGWLEKTRSPLLRRTPKQPDTAKLSLGEGVLSIVSDAKTFGFLLRTSACSEVSNINHLFL